MFHRKIVSPILNGANCTLRKYTCSGIKVCSKTSPDLQRFFHDEVSDSVLLALDITRRDIAGSRATNACEDPLRNTTWEYFEAAKRAKSVTCGERCAGGRLVAGYSRTVSTGRKLLYLAITNPIYSHSSISGVTSISLEIVEYTTIEIYRPLSISTVNILLLSVRGLIKGLRMLRVSVLFWSP
jgi:hypothetical protein